MGLRSDSGLEKLHNVVEEAVIRVGFPPEDRPFRPHLTLARFAGRVSTDRLAAALRQIEELDPVAVPVSRVSLFESVLGPGGARYRVVEEFAL